MQPPRSIRTPIAIVRRRASRWLRRMLAATAMFPLIAQAQEVRPPAIALLSGTLSFTGHATVGDFVGSTTEVSGMVVGDLSRAYGWVEASVATLDTRNALRDRDLRAAMEVKKYPTMRFDLTGLTVESPGAGGDSAAVRLHGRFTIHGVMRAVELPATVQFIADSTHVTAAFPLNMSEYGIGGLTKMFGLLRVQPRVDVRVDLWFANTVTATLRAEAP